MATSTLGSGTLVLAGTTSGTTTVTATAVAGTTTLTLPAATDTLVGKATTDTLTNKTLTGAAMNGTLGATTPSTVAATTLTTSSTVTHNGGTANGVAYLDGSKVLTTGSALTYDGTSLKNIGASNASLGAYSANGGSSQFILGNSAGTSHWSFYETIGAAGQQGVLNLYDNVSTSIRLTVDTSGNLLVGATSSAGEKFRVIQTATSVVAYWTNSNATPNGLFMNYSAASPNNTGSNFIQVADSSANRFVVNSNGGIQNYSANNVNLSDQREKKNIELAGNYLDKICAIPIKTFLFNDQTDTDKNLGAIAQDVQAVAPELVMESNWAGKDKEPKMRLSIYQTDLQYALMKCIQEQQALITQLTARITALESA